MPILPIHDGKALSHIERPYGTWALIVANVVAFLFTGTTEASQASAISYGLIPAVFNGYVDLPPQFEVIPERVTLLTYAFLHGDFWHLLGNMLFLWVFADNIEDAFGHIRFVLFYGMCAIGGGYAYVLTDPASQAPVIGASGAVAGVVAAYLILHPRQKLWVLALGRIPIRLRALWVLGFWALFQIYSVVAAKPGDSVAWWSHIGGFLTGAVLVFVMRRRGVPLFDRPARPPGLDTN